MTDLEDIRIIPEPTAARLNPRQQEDYRSEREDCLTWLLNVGKTPKKGIGYAKGTIKPRSNRIDQFYRWVWDNYGGYTTNVTPDHAEGYLRHLAQLEASGVHKSNSQKAVQTVLKWRHHVHGIDEWDPSLRFSGDSSSQPRDYLTIEEREKIREASLEYGSVPSYSNLSPAERDRWKAYLAQRFEKPKCEVSPDDWERANGWKIPSIVCTSLDAGLRPIEVARAQTTWVDVDNCLLRIPKEESSKSHDNWTVGITEQTAKMLSRWLSERRAYQQYTDTEDLWYTRQANSYRSSALKRVLERLCEIADIDTEGRQMSWYAIRHSVGTYMTREEDLAAAQAQLRHKSPETTMQYDQTPVENRRDALNRM